MSMNDGIRSEMDSSLILAAVVGQFDPYQGPQTTLRMVKPRSRCDDEAGLLWLMRYLLGDSTLTEDNGMIRMSKALCVEEPEIQLKPTSWNWKHLTFPDMGYSVVAVLFTDDITEANVVVALVADHELHGERVTACAPTIASIVVTAMLNRRREGTQPDDGVIDSFHMCHVANASDLRDMVRVADQVVAGGITLGSYRAKSAPCPAACAKVSESALTSYASDSELLAPLVHSVLSSTNVLIIGHSLDAVMRWLHAAAFLLPGHRRHRGTLVARPAMPVPTLSLQGCVLAQRDTDTSPNCYSRVMAAVKHWLNPPLVINTDDLRIDANCLLPMDNDKPDMSMVWSHKKSLFVHIHAVLQKQFNSRHSNGRGGDVEQSTSSAAGPLGGGGSSSRHNGSAASHLEEMEAWLVAMRAELDMLAKRCANMEGDPLQDAFPSMSPSDRLLIRAGLSDPGEQKRATDNVTGMGFVREFEQF